MEDKEFGISHCIERIDIHRSDSDISQRPVSAHAVDRKENFEEYFKEGYKAVTV